jgi:hypothetical protein
MLMECATGGSAPVSWITQFPPRFGGIANDTVDSPALALVHSL